MDPFLPLLWLLWAAAGAAVLGEILGWRARRAQRRSSRWQRRLRWVAVLFLVAAVLWLGVVVLDFLAFVRSPEP